MNTLLMMAQSETAEVNESATVGQVTLKVYQKIII
jgi:hypothetical protein